MHDAVERTDPVGVDGAVDGADEDDELLTLQEAADRLRVHYMTAYRWVRRGALPASKTGGRLRLRAHDLERFVAERRIDVALPTDDPGRTDWARHVDHLAELLLDGRGVEAGALARRVVADGAPAGDVYIRLIAPALHRVGDEWAAGRIGVGVERRASQIAGTLVARLGESFRRRGARRGTAVTLAAPGDRHGLASAMVADFLRAAGYDVHHLGTDVPIDEVRRFLATVPTDVVAVSMTNPDPGSGAGTGGLAELVAAARDATGGDADRGASRGDAPLVVVGGQGATPEAVAAAGAVHVADLSELAARLDALVEA